MVLYKGVYMSFSFKKLYKLKVLSLNTVKKWVEEHLTGIDERVEEHVRRSVRLFSVRDGNATQA